MPQLHVLATCPGDPTVDIVAVHGLNGHPIATFTHTPRSGRATLWLRDLLPNKIEKCRVMSFEYDSSITSMSEGRVRDMAGSLLGLLRDKREDAKYENTPIVFVGHSLGGIVIKQTLSLASAKNSKFQNISNATKGVVFFGTPHRGADAAKLGLLAKRIAGAVLRHPPARQLKLLQTHSEGLYRINEDFLPIAPQYAIVSFYEEYAYKIWGKVIVDKDSAIMGLQHEETMMLSGTHTSMCRFSVDDSQFDPVWRRIKRAAEGPGR
ncbi:hypothetical protein O1611_g3609 [Lasiodiplodia mahajangana]|uniref:Uncharacterized protein n=1 Tax=Lasiodiplodia mahajangana TaxID=1108764 RepID=A0ACC2JRN8_9PEZI|nr:hypothetical protein O1611_g3609 [Lasiodiplodia mahajangana]